MTDLRPPDAGTNSEWTFVGGGKVYVWTGGLPVVLGRPTQPSDSIVAIKVDRPGGPNLIMITPHQARALMEILPAAAAVADQEEE